MWATWLPLSRRTPEEFRSLGIEVRTGHEVMALDLPRQRVAVQGDGRIFWEDYDALVLATGAVPIVPSWPGVGAAGIFSVKTLADGDRIRRDIEEDPPRTAVVVGGGYIGLERAENLRHWDIETTLMDQQAQGYAGIPGRRHGGPGLGGAGGLWRQGLPAGRGRGF